jgi:hypothetical protein
LLMGTNLNLVSDPVFLRERVNSPYVGPLRPTFRYLF